MNRTTGLGGAFNFNNLAAASRTVYTDENMSK